MKARELFKKPIKETFMIADIDKGFSWEFNEGFKLSEITNKKYLKDLNPALDKEIRDIHRTVFGIKEYSVSNYTNEEREIKKQIKELEKQIKELKERLK